MRVRMCMRVRVCVRVRLRVRVRVWFLFSRILCVPRVGRKWCKCVCFFLFKVACLCVW